MSSALTDFQKLLKKTQKEMLLKPKETVEKTGKPVDKSNFLKFQQLPSVIKLPQTSSGSSGLKAAGSAPSKSLGPPASGSNHLGNNIKRTADTTARNNNTQASNTPKPKSFKELMKMAKAVKPEGLVRIEKPAEIPRERIRQPIDGNGVRQVMPSQQQKYRVVEPIHKMVQPKSKVYSPQTSKRGKKYVPSDLIKLNTNKRDLASTEEIQDELLRKRGVVKQPVFKDSRTMTATSKSSLDSLSRPKVAVANRDRGREVAPDARRAGGCRAGDLARQRG